MRVESVSQVVVGILAFQAMLPTAARAEEVPVEYRPAIAKGLEWLAQHQHQDGHWINTGSFDRSGQANFPVVITAMAGMALLMEGSTIREGRYHDNIRRAVDWLMARSQPNGLIGNPNNQDEAVRYIYGHGYAMMFLACVVGEEEDSDRRAKLIDILDRAAKFSHSAQSPRGGWGYLSCRDTPNDDEGSTTVTQLQGLRAARNAGIVVPNAVIKDALKYLHDTTGEDGGVRYSLARFGGGIGSEGRKTLTAAAIACSFSTGEYDSPLVKKWFKFCRASLPAVFFTANNQERQGHDEYTYYYFAQSVYMLGEDGWGKLFPDDRGPGLKWSTFRKGSFDALIKHQAADGSWGASEGQWWSASGPVYATAAYLSIMQLDKAVLPIYQR